MIYLLWIMAALLFLYLFRLFRGPSIWDRLLGMGLVSTKLVIILVVFASLYNQSFLLDLALVYTLLGFMGVIFIAQFFLDRTKNSKPEKQKLRDEK